MSEAMRKETAELIISNLHFHQHDTGRWPADTSTKVWEAPYFECFWIFIRVHHPRVWREVLIASFKFVRGATSMDVNETEQQLDALLEAVNEGGDADEAEAVAEEPAAAAATAEDGAAEGREDNAMADGAPEPDRGTQPRSLLACLPTCGCRAHDAVSSARARAEVMEVDERPAAAVAAQAGAAPRVRGRGTHGSPAPPSRSARCRGWHGPAEASGQRVHVLLPGARAHGPAGPSGAAWRGE